MMETMLLAGETAFDIDLLCSLVPEGLIAEVHDKTGGMRHLMIKTPTQFVAQIQACGEEGDADTMDDLKRMENQPPEFADALERRSLRFLLVTYADSEEDNLQRITYAFLQADLVKFSCSSTDEIEELG